MAKPHRALKKSNKGQRPANSKGRRLSARPSRPSREKCWLVRGTSEGAARDGERLDRRSLALRRAPPRRQPGRSPQIQSSALEIEQLDGILHEDSVRNACVGLKIVRYNEFWVRGHMPGFPLMPGVLLCEAAAQVASYFAAEATTCSGPRFSVSAGWKRSASAAWFSPAIASPFSSN